MKYITLLTTTVLVLFTGALMAQEEGTPTGWGKKAVGTLNFTQNSFDNWSQGGEDSWTWMLNINADFNKMAEKYTWKNNFKIAFGNTKVGSDGAKKAADEFNFETVYTRQMGPLVSPYVAATAKTQFTKGYDYTADPYTLKSDFLDPGYFTQSAGIGYQAGEHLGTRFGAAVKETLSKDHGYADDPDTQETEESKVEYGDESVTDLNLKLNETILLTSKLELFSNLKKLDQTDVIWDNLFSASLSKYITVSLNVKLFYDRDISRIRQLQQTLAVGLTYNLF